MKIYYTNSRIYNGPITASTAAYARQWLASVWPYCEIANLSATKEREVFWDKPCRDRNPVG
jgi:hypothetical protein